MRWVALSHKWLPCLARSFATHIGARAKPLLTLGLDVNSPPAGARLSIISDYPPLQAHYLTFYRPIVRSARLETGLAGTF
ncbi:hypothetical protein BD626DRAFT_486373 [Schizophyllum amplum]|uniref:Uncharacterized protein n=1 Tax=Schizophyllum amplum TaxID=97359 RepID=A0A550CME4_9AGAR|nr:hypothetical protein BD626DRAFT_486373 [Auriculariopsis ampla]